MREKRITIEALGSGAGKEIELSPATTVGQALQDIGLSANEAWLELDEPKRVLAPEEKLFPLVEPGAKLHASPRMDVG